MMASRFRFRLVGPDPVGFVAGNLVRRTDGVPGTWMVESVRVTRDRLELAVIALDRCARVELPCHCLRRIPNGGDVFDIKGRIG